MLIIRTRMEANFCPSLVASWIMFSACSRLLKYSLRSRRAPNGLGLKGNKSTVDKITVGHDKDHNSRIASLLFVTTLGIWVQDLPIKYVRALGFKCKCKIRSV